MTDRATHSLQCRPNIFCTNTVTAVGAPVKDLRLKKHESNSTSRKARLGQHDLNSPVQKGLLKRHWLENPIATFNGQNIAATKKKREDD
jgi:hypothetical protein